MNRNQDTKKILDKAANEQRYLTGGFLIDTLPYAKQINQLYEPQPDQSSRLLDIDAYLEEMGWTLSKNGMAYAWLKQFRDRQDAQTAEHIEEHWQKYQLDHAKEQVNVTAIIEDAECKARIVEREQLEKILFSFENGTEATTYYIDRILAITEVDHKAHIEALIQWGIEQCQEHYKGGGVISRRECPECWKSLKAEGRQEGE